MSAEFKRIAAQEIEEFKAEYRQRFPGRGVIKIDGEDDPPSSRGRHRA